MIGKNRYITILLLALTICMLLTACAYDAVNGEDDSMVSEAANETTVTEQETDTTNVLDNETIDTTDEASEQTTVIGQEPYDPEKEFDHLTHALTAYLEHLKYNFDMPNNNYETKMNHIKRGNQGLYVKFNSEEFYFVCAYSHSGHESEREDYCCKTLYKWVRFDNADEIVEYYGDNKFVVAFQINKSLFCKDIFTMESATVNMEHYQTYMPVFVEGVNIAQGLTFGETYVYIYPNDMIFDYCLFQNPRMIYHSFDCYYHDWVVFRCVEIGDIDYLKVHLHYEREDGHSGDLNIHSEFGEYYEDLMRVMITDQYSEYDKLGYRYDCGLFMIDDLINIIMN